MSVIDYSWDFTKEEFSLDLDFFNEKEQEDKLWQARTGLDFDTLCGAIETIVFMSDKPINLLKIKNQIDTDLPLRVVHESISRLQKEYEAKHHGIRLMEVAQGYQFRTKSTYSKIIQSMFKVSSLQLSPTAVEVLAIIAYKQPISKNTVESIRGVDSSHIIRALMDRRLVKVAGRSDEVGRPSLYGTTPEFLEVFNLNDITDLPSEIELEELATANEVGEIADIRNIVQNTDKTQFAFDEFEELEELSSSIKEIASDTIFTKSLKDMDRNRKTEEGVEKKSAFDILEEHVNLAQVISQNKNSIESETLTSVMEPKSVAVQLLNNLLNTPEVFADDELEIEVELEEEGSLMELQNQEGDFEELDSSSVKEIEAQADEVLAKSEEIINSIIDNPEQALDFQTGDLSAELDNAFDSLMSEENVDEVEEVLAQTEDTTPVQTPEVSEVKSETTPIDMDLDLSSFIAAKIASATPAEEVQEVNEAEELEQALDAAFENLTGESLDASDTDTQELSVEDLDLDLDFLNTSTEDENNTELNN
jgi:segregation and condensation protein B